MLLDQLGVTTPGLDQACERARQAGALGAKMTGAGGGGCVVALAPDRQAEVAQSLGGQAPWVCQAWLGQPPEDES